jgi:hypothetical protein
MSYLDTMYEGLFKEAAPWGNAFGKTFGNAFSNQDNGAAPDKQPEPPKPMAVPAAQQNQSPAPEPKPQNQFAPKAVPRALTAEEQGIKPQPAPRALTWEEQQKQNQPPVQPQPEINPYAGMPQTQEDWQRNQQENPGLWEQPGEIENVPADWNPDIPAEYTPEQRRALAEQKYLRGEQLTPEENRMLRPESPVQTVSEQPPTTTATNAGTQPPPAFSGKPQAPFNQNARITADANGKIGVTRDIRTTDGQVVPRFVPFENTQEITQFGLDNGLNQEFIQSDAFQKNMTDEQRIAYLTGALENDIRAYSEANATVGDATDKFMNEIANTWDDIMTNGSVSRFIRTRLFGMEDSEEATQLRQEELNARTKSRDDALKMQFMNKYLESEHGKAMVSNIVDNCPLSTVKQMVDTLQSQGTSSGISEQATQMLTNAVQKKCYNALSENFFGNLPMVASLWLKQKGLGGLAGFAENPWIFYSGLIALLLGGGALIGGALGLFGGGDGGGSTVVVQQSPQDSYRQNLYRTF